jgi:hypothetical protein
MAFFKDPTATADAFTIAMPVSELLLERYTRAAAADDEGRAVALHRPAGLRP